MLLAAERGGEKPAITLCCPTGLPDGTRSIYGLPDSLQAELETIFDI
jgi:hypothetical protein